MAFRELKKLLYMKIVNNKGELILNLYHGTSGLFLQSILEHGLGGRNPIDEMNVIDLAGELYELRKSGCFPRKLKGYVVNIKHIFQYISIFE